MFLVLGYGLLVMGFGLGVMGCWLDYLFILRNPPLATKKTQPKTMNINLFYETNYAIIYDCSYHHARWMQVAGQCQH